MTVMSIIKYLKLSRKKKLLKNRPTVHILKANLSCTISARRLAGKPIIRRSLHEPASPLIVLYVERHDTVI